MRMIERYGPGGRGQASGRHPPQVVDAPVLMPLIQITNGGQPWFWRDYFPRPTIEEGVKFYILPLGGVDIGGTLRLVVVVWSDGTYLAFVVDAGGATEAEEGELTGVPLLGVLRRLVENRMKISAIVLSHAHHDHLGSLIAALEIVQIGNPEARIICTETTAEFVEPQSTSGLRIKIERRRTRQEERRQKETEKGAHSEATPRHGGHHSDNGEKILTSAEQKEKIGWLMGNVVTVLWETPFLVDVDEPRLVLEYLEAGHIGGAAVVPIKAYAPPLGGEEALTDGRGKAWSPERALLFLDTNDMGPQRLRGVRSPNEEAIAALAGQVSGLGIETTYPGDHANRPVEERRYARLMLHVLGDGHRIFAPLFAMERPTEWILSIRHIMALLERYKGFLQGRLAREMDDAQWALIRDRIHRVNRVLKTRVYVAGSAVDMTRLKLKCSWDHPDAMERDLVEGQRSLFDGKRFFPVGPEEDETLDEVIARKGPVIIGATPGMAMLGPAEKVLLSWGKGDVMTTVGYAAKDTPAYKLQHVPIGHTFTFDDGEKVTRHFDVEPIRAYSAHLDNRDRLRICALVWPWILILWHGDLASRESAAASLRGAGHQNVVVAKLGEIYSFDRVLRCDRYPQEVFSPVPREGDGWMPIEEEKVDVSAVYKIFKERAGEYINLQEMVRALSLQPRSRRVQEAVLRALKKDRWVHFAQDELAQHEVRYKIREEWMTRLREGQIVVVRSERTGSGRKKKHPKENRPAHGHALVSRDAADGSVHFVGHGFAPAARSIEHFVVGLAHHQVHDEVHRLARELGCEDLVDLFEQDPERVHQILRMFPVPG